MTKVRIAIVLCSLPLIQACEKQEWKETKMFHDVPKAKSEAQHPAAPAEKAAEAPVEK